MKQQILQPNHDCSIHFRTEKKNHAVNLRQLLNLKFSFSTPMDSKSLTRGLKFLEILAGQFSNQLIKLLEVIFKNSLSLLINQRNLNPFLFDFKFLIINSILITVNNGFSDNSILQ